MGGKSRESSIKISIYDDDEPQSLKNKLKKIPIVKPEKQTEQQKFRNNLGVSIKKDQQSDK